MKYTQYPPVHMGVAPQIHVPSGNGNEQIRVTSLILRETNTYQDQQYRPYQTQLTHDAVSNFQNTFNEKYTITAGDLSGFANSIVMPSAQDRGMVPIVEGWQGKKFIFLMEIEVNRFAGAAELVVLTGYTDHVGASRSGALNENMRLYFNNAVKMQRIVDNLGTGIGYSNVIQDVSQVIYENPWATRTLRDSPAIVTLRPNDIFGRMQANYLQGDVEDWRNGQVSTEPVKFSKAVNSSATNYISRIVSNLKTAVAAQHNEWTHTLANAQTFVPENKCRLDFVFKAFLNSTDFNIGKSVTIGDLMDISPTLDSVTNVIFTSNTDRDRLSYDNTQHWQGSNYETIFASTLAHSVPALMMECMIRSVSFKANNWAVGGGWDILITNIPHAFSRGINLDQYLSIWRQRMLFEVLSALMPDYYVPVEITMICDITRDTEIYISYDGGPEIPFLNPSFANTLTSPVISNSQDDLLTITGDMENLCTAAGLNDDFERGNHHGFNPVV